jgi:hypothetical protein
MSQDEDRTFAMLASRDERIQSYLRTTRSTDDIVRDVTQAFAGDVARIMAEVGARQRQTRVPAESQAGAQGAPNRRRRG